MRIVAFLFAIVLGLLGATFCIAAIQGNAFVRIVIGLILLGAAIALIIVARMKTERHEIVNRTELELELTGDVKLENLECRNCSAKLSADAIDYKAGTIFVNCPYCGSTYQLEEAAKW